MTRTILPGPAPVIDRNQEARARKLARLDPLAASLRTAAAQLVAHLQRQEPVAAQIERLTTERRAALATMRSLAGSTDMDAFRAACAREAELAVRIRRLQAEVSHG